MAQKRFRPLNINYFLHRNELKKYINNELLNMRTRPEMVAFCLTVSFLSQSVAFMFLQLATYLHINKVNINKEAVSYVSVTRPNYLSQQFKTT